MNLCLKATKKNRMENEEKFNILILVEQLGISNKGEK